MNLNILCLFILGYCTNLFNAKKNYSGYALFRGRPIEHSHLDFFTSLPKEFDVNFWTQPNALYQTIDFIINPNDRAKMLTYALAQGVDLIVVREDVQSVFDHQKVTNDTRRKPGTMNWNDYFSLTDIYNWLNDLAKTYPEYVLLTSIGKTVNNNDILSVKIANVLVPTRSAVIVEGGIHGREWISTAFVTYLINEIVNAITSNSSKETDLKSLAKTYEWHFVPILNPDGYETTQNEDRLWRKNRNGEGVDINRNFDYHFTNSGMYYYPVSQEYSGPQAFSEEETKAMARLVGKVSDHLEYYLSFHSYGQHIILPYPHTTEHRDNYDEMYEITREAANKIAQPYGTKYDVGTSYDTVGYLATGGSMGWVKEFYRVRYAVTFELRDTGTYGFVLPPNEIMPTCEETLEGLKHLLQPRNPSAKRLSFTVINPENYERDFSEQTIVSKTVFVLYLFFYCILL